MEIHIGNAIAIGKTEGFSTDMLPHAPQPAASERGIACVHEGDAPRFSLAAT
jgi:hypothetical protein